MVAVWLLLDYPWGRAPRPALSRGGAVGAIREEKREDFVACRRADFSHGRRCVWARRGRCAALAVSPPASAQKGIEKIRNSCKEEAGEAVTFPGDSGLTEFLLGGKRAVMIDHGMICGDCVKGVACSNRGQRLIEIYRLQGTAWRKVLSEDQFAEDIYLSFEPGGKADGQEF